MILSLGSSVVIGQLSLIFYGTFHLYSWDIMEPICYLMTFGNFTAGFYFYLFSKRDLDLTNFHEILTLRFTHRACARHGINLAKHEANRAEVERLRNALKVIF